MEEDWFGFCFRKFNEGFNSLEFNDDMLEDMMIHIWLNNRKIKNRKEKIKTTIFYLKEYIKYGNEIWELEINPFIIEFLVLWKNSRKRKLNQVEDETPTTSNKLLRRN